MKKILYIVDSPFCERDYHRFGIEYFETKGYQVTVLDITPALYPSVHQAPPPDAMAHPGLITACTKEEVVRYLEELDQTVTVFCFFSQNNRSMFIFQEMPDGIQYFLFYLNPIPSCCKREAYSLKYFFTNLKLLPGAFERRVHKVLQILRYYIRKSNYHPPDYIFLGAAAAYACIPHPFLHTPKDRMVYVHTLDYDLFLERFGSPRGGKGAPVVFIDQCGPFDVDRLYSGIPVLLTADKYYPALNRFFDRIEKSLHKQVIIAAHPRSHDQINREHYGGRECIRGDTLDLIAQSGLVITHGSTAINFAILYKKPIMLVTTDQWDQTYPGHTCGYARPLGKTVYNIDNNREYPFDSEMTVNPDAYTTYRLHYIKGENTPEIPLWQVVEGYIR